MYSGGTVPWGTARVLPAFLTLAKQLGGIRNTSNPLRLSEFELLLNGPPLVPVPETATHVDRSCGTWVPHGTAPVSPQGQDCAGLHPPQLGVQGS